MHSLTDNITKSNCFEFADGYGNFTSGKWAHKHYIPSHIHYCNCVFSIRYFITSDPKKDCGALNCLPFVSQRENYVHNVSESCYAVLTL